MRGQPDQIFELERAEPCRVELDADPLHVEDPAELSAVRLGVRADLLPRERLARLRTARGIADHPGEIADHDDDLVPEILEIAELAQDHGMAQMQIGRGGIETELDDQRAPRAPRTLELLAQLRLHDDARGAAAERAQLVVDRGKLQRAHGTNAISCCSSRSSACASTHPRTRP